ncbi:MAG TPA: AMP-binding protein, partial [Tistrella mobilis]|nr:AMP-binding protein [Tistrella mobilis]
FTAFGPKAIEHRTATAGTKLIVTDAQNRDKLNELSVPATIAVIRGGAGAGDLDFDAELAAQSPDFAPVMRQGEDPFLIMFTSGTTGPA